MKIISAAREDWVPQQRQPESIPKSLLEIKVKRDELSLDIGKSSHKEWIQQYLEREEEVHGFLSCFIAGSSCVFELF